MRWMAEWVTCKSNGDGYKAQEVEVGKWTEGRAGGW